MNIQPTYHMESVNGLIYYSFFNNAFNDDFKQARYNMYDIEHISHEVILEKIQELGFEIHGEYIESEVEAGSIYASLCDPNYLPLAHLYIHFYNKTNRIMFNLACIDKEIGDEYYLKLIEIFPKIKDEDDKLQVHFWYNGPNGATEQSRKIEIQHWSELKDNYVGKTQGQLDTLLNLSPDDLNGNMILWLGEPGTGKTHVLRALGDAWRDKARFHYIIDPELFLGDSSYMMNAISRMDADDKYNLIVFEDAGELLSMDAKDRIGQGFSRLLNIMDGILGQGLKIKILITTNEDIEKIHSAILREGRCGAKIEFENFNRDQADQWLLRHENEGLLYKHTKTYYQLSDLYAIKNNAPMHIEQKEKKIGF